MRPQSAPLSAGTNGGFARWWTELVADLADHVPGGVAGLALIVLVLAGAVVAARYAWPHRHQWRTGRRQRTGSDADPQASPEEDSDSAEPDGLPDRPPAELRTSADRYAAAGRYAEAVRERLRAMVRDLVDRQILVHHPGWTVTELAAAAAGADPGLAGPMREAAELFSGIWYGRRPATAAHDARMRVLADQVAAPRALSAPGGAR